MRYTVTQFARESVGLCPFRGSYVRKFEFLHNNPVSRIITIIHAHNLHLKVLDFVGQADTETQWNTSQASLFYSFH